MASSFQEKNLRRMSAVSEVFSRFIKLSHPGTEQLAGTHFTIIIPLKKSDERDYYAQQIIESKMEQKRTFEDNWKRKSFQRKEIAKLHLSETDVRNTNQF